MKQKQECEHNRCLIQGSLVDSVVKNMQHELDENKQIGDWLTMWVPLLLSRFCPNVLLLSRSCPDLVSFVSCSCPLSRF